MSSLSQFAGGGGVPVGGYIQALDAPVNFTQNGQEYLRAGSIKAYDASYASAIATAPQLRVFGNDAKTYGSTTSLVQWRYYYIGTNYVALNNGATQARYGSALNSIASATTGMTTQHLVQKRAAVNGTSFLVVPHNAANIALWYTADGASFTAVGGTFATCPVKTAVCFGNNSWLALSSLNSVAGEQAYINAANPSGSWTVGSSGASITASSVNAISYGGGVFVAVTADTGSATSKKIATCPTVGGTWTDRTAASGIVFAANEAIVDVVYSGTAHVAVTSSGRCISSTDGINWTLRASPFDYSTTAPWGVSGFSSYAVNGSELELTTDGAGTVICNVNGASATKRALFAISTDSGATWIPAQPYLGKVAIGSGSCRSVSYANSRWIENHSADYQSLVDIGTSLATPDYVGQQNTNLGIALFVRIK